MQLDRGESCFWLRVNSEGSSGISISFHEIENSALDRIGNLLLIKDEQLVASLWPPISHEVALMYAKLAMAIDWLEVA